MAAPKDDYVEIEGMVVEVLPGGQFRVELTQLEKPDADSADPAKSADGAEVPSVIATVAGKMRRNRIKPVIGDRVRVEVSLYDLARGRIVYRLRDGEEVQSGARHQKVQRRGSRGMKSR